MGFAYPGIGPPTKVLWWGLAKGFVNAPRGGGGGCISLIAEN